MRTDNPTPLRVGMSGTFASREYRIIGRIVMSMDDGGETYYWNEFNLVSTDGQCATLVHEPTDGGESWKFFTLIEPTRPPSAEDSAKVRVGDQIDFTGESLRVTLTGESRVRHIEGTAPEGVELGDAARFYNAEGGREMVVVSWTGDEVEIYRGINIPANSVPDAFKLPASERRFTINPATAAAPMASDPRSPLKWLIPLAIGALLAAGALGIMCRKNRRQAVPAVPTLAPAPLKTGAAGTIAGNAYRVVSHAEMELGEVGRRFRVHEYELDSDAAEPALLVYGSRDDSKGWLLAEKARPENPMTPVQAAGRKNGEWVPLGSSAGQITSLFRVTTLRREPAGTNRTFFGFSAKGRDGDYWVRWTDTDISYYRVKAVPVSELKRGFPELAR